MKTKNIALIFLLSIGISQMENALARGLIAGALEDAGVIDSNEREILDDTHKNLGNPLDNAAAPIVQQTVPMSPRCATQFGVGIVGWGPIGAPCNFNGAYGQIVP